MSLVPQTRSLPQIWSRLRPYVLPAVALLAFTALIPVAGPMARLAAAARPHAPDIGLLAIQPLVIQLHVAGAAGALLLGTAIMLWRKGRSFHRIAGWGFVALMTLAAGSSVFITGLNGDHWSFIHLFTGWTLIGLPIAVVAARRGQIGTHRGTMTGLYLGGLLINSFIAFLPGRLMWRMVFG